VKKYIQHINSVDHERLRNQMDCPSVVYDTSYPFQWSLFRLWFLDV